MKHTHSIFPLPALLSIWIVLMLVAKFITSSWRDVCLLPIIMEADGILPALLPEPNIHLKNSTAISRNHDFSNDAIDLVGGSFLT